MKHRMLFFTTVFIFLLDLVLVVPLVMFLIDLFRKFNTDDLFALLVILFIEIISISSINSFIGILRTPSKKNWNNETKR